MQRRERMKRVKKVTASLILCLTAIGCFSCTNVTPLTRIEENPAMYHALPAEQQELVRQGRICNGMGQDAVFLAWGMPNSRPLMGQKGKKSFEKWVYNRMRPVMVARPYPIGFYGPGCWDPYWGSGWDTAYVPEVYATVTFEKGKVTDWERSGAAPLPTTPVTPYTPENSVNNQ